MVDIVRPTDYKASYYYYFPIDDEKLLAPENEPLRLGIPGADGRPHALDIVNFLLAHRPSVVMGRSGGPGVMDRLYTQEQYLRGWSRLEMKYILAMQEELWTYGVRADSYVDQRETLGKVMVRAGGYLEQDRKSVLATMLMSPEYLPALGPDRWQDLVERLSPDIGWTVYSNQVRGQEACNNKDARGVKLAEQAIEAAQVIVGYCAQKTIAHLPKWERQRAVKVQAIMAWHVWNMRLIPQMRLREYNQV